MTRLTYFEPLTAGHCAFWAEILLEAAISDERFTALRLVAGEGLIERLAQTISIDDIDIEVLSEPDLTKLADGRLVDRGRAQWAKARELLANGGGQLFLPFFDHALYGAIADRRPVRGQISGIVFRPPNDFNLPPTSSRQLDSLRRWASYFAARRPALRTLFTLDERASQSRISRALRLLQYIPDPAPDLTPLVGAAVYAAPKGDRSIALVFGALSRRKGIFKMLEALEHLSPAQKGRFELRFVGKLDDADRSEFLAACTSARAQHPQAIVSLLDHYVSDAELAGEVAAADMVFAPYQHHIGSSGVVYWAAAAGKPLISQNTGYMGWQVATCRLGLTIDTTDAKALARALVTEFPTQPIPEAFLAEHTGENFARAILDRLL